MLKLLPKTQTIIISEVSKNMQKTSITSSFEMSNSCQNLGGTAWSSSAGSTVSIAASFRKADPRTCGSPTMWSLRSAAQAATALAGICTHRRAHTLGSNDGSGGSHGCSAIHHECLLRLGTGCLTWEASIAAMVSQFGRRHLPHSIHLHEIAGTKSSTRLSRI